MDEKQKIYDELLESMNNDFEVVKDKIHKCHYKLMDSVQNKYELKVKIDDCSNYYLVNFHRNWFMPQSKDLEGSPYFNKLIQDGFDKYMELSRVSSRLAGLA